MRRFSAAPITAWEHRVQTGAHPVLYRALRLLAGRAPTRVPGLGVVVSDAPTLRSVLLDTEHFTKVGPGAPSDLWTPVLGPSVLLNMEGADHLALRRALSPLFTPKAARSLVADDSHLTAMTERLAAGERVDLVRAVSDLAGTTICRMTGIPSSHGEARAAFAGAQRIVGLVRLHRRTLTNRQVAHARAVLAQLTEPARAAYRAGDESTVPGRMRALGLSEHEAMGAVGAFVLTGTETIQSFTPRLVALAHDTGWLEKLLGADRGRIIEEALRITVPTPVMLRSARSRARVGDVDVRPGERMVLATILACHAYGPFDPDKPQDPDVRQLWFGAGPHFCLGMPLAMAETHAVLDALAQVGRLQVVSRSVARGVLIPAYRSVVLEKGVVSDILAQILAQADDRGDDVALVGSTTLTFRALADRIRATAGALDLTPGDRVLFSIRPSVEGIVFALGAVAAGGVLTFVDPGSTPELFEARLSMVNPTVAATESVLYTLGTRALRGQARRRGLALPRYRELPVRHVYAGRWLPGVPRGAIRAAALARGAARPDPVGAAVEDALIVFTSGTTAAPKAVVHSRASLAGAAASFRAAAGLRPGGIVYTDQMMLGVPALAEGAAWHLPPAKPGTAAFAKAMPAGATTFLVPAHFATMPAAPAGRILVGGGPVPASLVSRSERLMPGTPVLGVYGMTEMLPIAFVDGADKLDYRGRGDLVGRPAPAVTVRVVDDELLVSGPGLAAALLHGSQRQDLVECATGDVAFLDAGRIVLAGRTRDMIIRGTVNIYPGLYEPRLERLDGVARALLVGLPGAGDERVGLAVCATFAAGSGAPTVTFDSDLVRRVRQVLPGVLDHGALPDVVAEVSFIPVAGRSAKPDRAALATALSSA